MIDWNGDGKIDGEDLIITEMILDDEEDEYPEFQGGSGCLASVLLFVCVLAGMLLRMCL